MLASGAVECLQSALVVETTAQQSQNYRLSEQLLYWGMKCHLVPRLYFQSNTALADASQLAHKLPRINIEMASAGQWCGRVLAICTRRRDNSQAEPRLQSSSCTTSHLAPRLYCQSNTALADAAKLAHKLPRINIINGQWCGRALAICTHRRESRQQPSRAKASDIPLLDDINTMPFATLLSAQIAEW